VLGLLEPVEIAPDLVDVYFQFYGNMVDSIMEAYEEVMGDGTPLREDWLRDMGIDKDGIPNIIAVCDILNKYSLGYIYNDTLYNFMQLPIFISGGVKVDDAI
jgi:hypothetical protein